jgi:hypothetical protein
VAENQLFNAIKLKVENDMRVIFGVRSTVISQEEAKEYIEYVKARSYNPHITVGRPQSFQDMVYVGRFEGVDLYRKK